MNEDKIIKLELSLTDVNAVLAQLMKMKYSQVANLIVKIQNQTLPQITNIEN